MLAAIPLSYQVGHFRGWNAGVNSVEVKEIVRYVEKKKEVERKKQEIRRLDDDALVRRYCHWVYDLSYDECVRTVKPVE